MFSANKADFAIVGAEFSANDADFAISAEFSIKISINSRNVSSANARDVWSSLVDKDTDRMIQIGYR